MKAIATYLLALLTIIFFACSPDKQPEQSSQQPDPSIPTLNTNQSSAAAGGVQHYVCPNNCEGSGSSVAGTCPTCGSEYQHNALYHSANNTQQAQPAPDYSQMNKSPLFKDAQAAPSTTTIQTSPEGGAVAGVQHYICPNGCAGSGGDSSGNCPVCGTEYQHNAAYHSSNQSTTVDPTQVQSASSAQNAAGEYHYICSNGCSGGAASSGTCSQCGAALAHNSAYHQ